MKKIIINIAILLLVICILSSTVFAAVSDPISNPGSWKPDNVDVGNKVQTITGKILGLVRNIGVSVSVIALMVIGIKYMTGSIEQKAKYKQSMVPYMVGIILLAAGTSIIKIIYDIAIKI